MASIGEQVRRRVLRWLARTGLLAAEDARDMRAWDNGGFSRDASVRIAGDDRAGLERLLRYCARPRFARERIAQVKRSKSSSICPGPDAMGARRCRSPRWS
jgi:hypothetical protein